jgi:hypothetical protein
MVNNTFLVSDNSRKGAKAQRNAEKKTTTARRARREYGESDMDF